MKLTKVLLTSLIGLIPWFSAMAENTAHQLLDEQLIIELPSELRAMSSTAIEKRYGNQTTPPSHVFNNKDKNVSFSVTQYPTPANKKAMNKIHKSISNMLRQANGQANWKKDKVYTRLGTKIAVYEYETKAIGKYQYNLTYALPVNQQLTFISFITTDKKYKSKWVTLARESLKSIRLTEGKLATK